MRRPKPVSDYVSLAKVCMQSSGAEWKPRHTARQNENLLRTASTLVPESFRTVLVASVHFYSDLCAYTQTRHVV